MPQVSKNPLTPKIEERVYKIFIESFKKAKSNTDIVNLLNDLLSKTQKVMLSKRLSIAFLLIEDKYTLRGISKILKVSLGTIEKINAVLALQGTGYRKVIRQMLSKKDLKDILAELAEKITPVPPKGVNRANWYRRRRKAKMNRKEPLVF